MSDIALEDIKKCCEKWDVVTRESEDCAEDIVSFIQEQKQWVDDIESRRLQNGDECLQINLVQKYIASVKARSRTIDLVTGQVPVQSEGANIKKDERKVFKMIFDELAINQINQNIFRDGFSQTCDFGVSAYIVEPDYINSTSLNMVPRVRLLPPDAKLYFDPNATAKTKNNGAFAGFKRNIKSSTLKSLYPGSSILEDETDITVYTHFYKSYEDKEYFCVKGTGEYKLEEAFLYTEERDTSKEPRKRRVPCVYFCRIADVGGGEVLVKPQKFPITSGIDSLPIVFNYGRSAFTPKRIVYSPLGAEMIDAQRYLNYLVSQTASIATSCTGDKLLGTQEHIIDGDDAVNVSDINRRSGWITLGSSPKDVMHILSSQIPESLLNAAEYAKKMLQEIGGAFINTDSMNMSNVSGVAFDKMFRHQDMLQDPLILAHIDSIDACARIVKNMLPYVITEERTLYIRKEDTEVTPIKVNRFTKDTLTLENNIRDICNIYDYKVSATVSDDLEKQNAASLALDLMKINPEFVKVLSGVLVDCFPNAYKDDIIKRIRATQDPNFIELIDGKISLEEYQKMMMQQAQQASSKQEQMEQLAVEKAQKEVEIKQFDSESKRLDIVNKAQVASESLEVNKAKASADIAAEEHRISTSLVKEEIAHANAVLNAKNKEG